MALGDTVVALAVTVVAALVCWRHWRLRNAARRQADRVAGLTQRIRAAVDSAVDCVQVTDLIVQHAKDPTATRPELAGLARLARGSLLALIGELDAQAKTLQNWQAEPVTSRRDGRFSFVRSWTSGRRGA